MKTTILPALWPLVSAAPLPRIHVLSDIHLESGPYALPDGLVFDILVAAGDIGPLDIAVPWLASLNCDVVYVLGNHEYWDEDVGTAVARAKTLAHGTRVRVLERDSVVLQGVRFLGTTLWTSYGNWDERLVADASRRMNDYRYIKAAAWLADPANRQAYGELLAEPPTDTATGFDPAIAYIEHTRSIAWLEAALNEDTEEDLPCVVVTHHAPAFACLQKAGVSEQLLDPKQWGRRYRDDNLVRVAAYASPLDEWLAQVGRSIDVWAHGHLHKSLDLVVGGVRVLANPRGRYSAPLTEKSAQQFAWMGVHLSQEDIDRSQALALENPYRGDNWAFEPDLVIDLEDGLRRPLTQALAEPIERLSALYREARSLLPYVLKDTTVPTQSVEKLFGLTVREFRELVEHAVLPTAQAVDPDVRSSLNTLEPPALPYEPMAFGDRPLTRSDYLREIVRMRAWVRWTRALPHAAGRELRHWAARQARALDYLSTRAVAGQARRLPVSALRRIDEHRLVVVHNTQDAPVSDNDLSDELSELFNGKIIPRKIWFSVRGPEWEESLANSLTAGELAPYANH